jgi:hypothetical protein
MGSLAVNGGLEQSGVEDRPRRFFYKIMFLWSFPFMAFEPMYKKSVTKFA